MLSTDDIRALNEARTILQALERDCGDHRRDKPDSYTDPDGYDYGCVAAAARAAEWAIFQALNEASSSRVRRIPDELLHNTEDSPVRHHGRIEDATTDSDDDGFHITIITDSGAHEYAAGDGRAILDAAAPILDHWTEGQIAAAEHQRHLEAVPGDGYDPTDPKSEGWHNRMSEIHDSREKA
jgi:hypothetical protein